MRLNYLDFMMPAIVQAMKGTGGGSDDLQQSIALDASSSFNSVLNSAMDNSDREKLMASCQELEAVFIGKIMEAMRSTIQRSELFERGFAEETFESMLYEEYATSMSQTGQLGLAQVLYKQLESNLEDK